MTLVSAADAHHGPSIAILPESSEHIRALIHELASLPVSRATSTQL